MSAEIFAQGIAVGNKVFRRDEVLWRFREKYYRCWTRDCVLEAKWNGYFYEMDVKKLKRLVRERKAVREENPYGKD